MKTRRVAYYQNNVSTGGVGRYVFSLLSGLDKRIYEPLMIMRRHEDPETAAYLEALNKLGTPVFFVDEEGRSVESSVPPSFQERKTSQEFKSSQSSGRFPFSRHRLIPHQIKTFLYRLRLVWNIKTFFDRQRLDILHLNLGYFPKLTYVCLGAVFSRIPKKILTIHSIDFSRKRQAPFRKLIAAGFDSIIVMNELIRKELVEFYRFPPGKIRVIYNGVEEASENGRREETRRLLGVDEETRLVLVPARMDPLKGHEILLRAAALVRADMAFKIFFAGDGPLETELKQKVKELSLEQNILFGGFRQDMPQLYAACDFVVLPSFLEGFPYALLEGMAAEKPVIGTDVGGVRDMIGEDGAGIIVPAHDAEALAQAMKTLFSESSERLRQRGEKGRKRIESLFSRRQMLEKTFSCYD